MANASDYDGTYLSFSSMIMVWRVQPLESAKSDWVIPRSSRSFFTWFRIRALAIRNANEIDHQSSDGVDHMNQSQGPIG